MFEILQKWTYKLSVKFLVIKVKNIEGQTIQWRKWVLEWPPYMLALKAKEHISNPF